MFRILGSDGKEYGPVTTETLRDWIRQNRATPLTMARADGQEEWQPLGSMPEFESDFKTAATAIPAPAPVAGALPSATGRPPTCGSATASLVLGLCGFLCAFTTIPGIIFGLIAMKKIKASQGALGGRGLALAGTIISCCVLVVAIALAPGKVRNGLAKAKGRANQIECVNNMRGAVLALRVYAASHSDRLPDADRWCDALGPGVASLRCPADPDTVRCSYAFNQNLSGRALQSLPGDIVLLFEGSGGWNRSGDAEALQSPSRHARFIVGFVDGHVEMLSGQAVANLRWKP
jgi:prepilin-type processing-associated H-X9-DG protein